MITISCIEKEEKYEVNGKIVYLDSEENWVATQELTTNEKQAFENYRHIIIENEGLKSHPRATYRG